MHKFACIKITTKKTPTNPSKTNQKPCKMKNLRQNKINYILQKFVLHISVFFVSTFFDVVSLTNEWQILHAFFASFSLQIFSTSWCEILNIWLIWWHRCQFAIVTFTRKENKEIDKPFFDEKLTCYSITELITLILLYQCTKTDSTLSF